MIYTEALPALRAGDILAFRRTGWLSRIVEHVSGGSYSHIGIVLMGKDGPEMLEAREFYGIRITTIPDALPADWIPMGVDWDEDIDAFARSHIGLKYSYLDAIRVGFGLDPSKDGHICSLLVAELLDRAGVAHIPRKGCSPSAVVDALLDRDFTVRHIAA